VVDGQVSVSTTLLDFFRRGEVPRDVKLLAAAGALAPRAHDQLAILVVLLDDADAEIRRTASNTIDAIPVEALTAFLARSDVPIGVREFFADRGIFPAEIPAISADDPLIERGTSGQDTSDEGEGESRESLLQQIAKMSFSDRLRAAMKGSREVRAILIRDPNKMVAASVLSSPKLTENEVESFARMANNSDEILRVIAGNRAWMKNYGIVVGLARNPKTPVALSLNLLARLNDRDVNALSMDRNVPEPLRTAARRRVVFGQSR
jgi:hypothetical protein